MKYRYRWYISLIDYMYLSMRRGARPHPFLLPFWRAVLTYRPIWGEDCLHSHFIRQSPSWGYPEFSSVVMQIPGDICTAAGIICDRCDWRDTRGKWPLARNPHRGWCHRHTSLKLFWLQSMSPWTVGVLNITIWFRISGACRDIQPWTRLFNINIFTPLYSWKSKTFNHLLKER